MAQAGRPRPLLRWHPRRTAKVAYASLQMFASWISYLPLAWPILTHYRNSERLRYVQKKNVCGQCAGAA